MQIADVEKLAELARIDMAQEEKEEILKDLRSILGYVDQITKAEAAGTADETILRNVMREDRDAHQSGIYTEKILAAAQSEDGFVKVQSIL